MLNCLHDTLEVFNSCPEFEQYMINYPFTNDNISISIFIQPPKIAEIYYPDIAAFSFICDTLRYNSNTIEVPYLYAHEEVESYEEALKIVETQNEDSH